MRLICLICWSFVIPMFCVPEPDRNATNKEAVQQKEAEMIQFSQLEQEQKHDEEPTDGVSNFSIPVLNFYHSIGLIFKSYV